MDEDDAIGFALLKISGGDKETDVEPVERDQCGSHAKPRCEAAGQRIKRLRR